MYMTIKATAATPSFGPYDGSMPKRIPVPLQGKETFGRRLARLRKAAGLTQLDLAGEIGISRRMVAYYEGQTDQPPASLIPLLARSLNVTADELFGLKPVRQQGKPARTRVWRRVEQLEKLPPRERRHILHMIEIAIDREQLKKRIPA